MQEVRIIILDEKDTKQFGFHPKDIQDIEVEDDSIGITLKTAIKERKKTVKKKAKKKKKKSKRGPKKGKKRGSYKKKKVTPTEEQTPSGLVGVKDDYKKPPKKKRKDNLVISEEDFAKVYDKNEGNSNAIARALGCAVSTAWKKGKELEKKREKEEIHKKEIQKKKTMTPEEQEFAELEEDIDAMEKYDK